MDVEEQIKRGYPALGVGADKDVLAMLDAPDGEPAEWAVHRLGAFGRNHCPESGVVIMELFRGLPSHFELIGVDPQTWEMNRRHTRLTVTGRFRTRPRGSWEVVALPFVHIWDFVDGHVDKVASLLDGIELRRRAPDRVVAGAA